MDKKRQEKITMCKNQINNIDVIGRILTQESNLISDYNKKNNIVSDKTWFERKAKLDNVQTSLNVVISHFEDRAKAIESQLKLLTINIEEEKND